MSGWANSGSGLDLVSESDGFAEQQDGAAPGMGFCVQDEKAVDGADTRACVRACVRAGAGCRRLPIVWPEPRLAGRSLWF